MTQMGARYVTPWSFCKSRAFRSGYEDCRRGRAPAFGAWGEWDVAYEIGRQTAVFLTAEGADLGPIPTASKISPEDVAWLRDASRRLFSSGLPDDAA